MSYPLLKQANTTTGIDVEALKLNARLYNLVAGYLGDNGKLKPGIELPVDIADRLEDFLAKEEDRKIERMQANDQRRLDEEIKRVNDLNAARARLEEWVKTGGLLNIKSNAEAIDQWIRTSDTLLGAKGKFSPQTVDAAIAFLGKRGSNLLQWAAPKQPAAPVVEASAPVEFLPDGSERLAIGTKPQYWHTKEQLRDLDRRTRESLGLNKDRQGWRGAGSIV
jgi:hypothetical protein